MGATDKDDVMDTGSSSGPSATIAFQGFQCVTKPDVSAPGKDICSAAYDNVNGYRTLTGTSMACPHVAGLVALLLSKNGNVHPERVRNCLTGGAVHTNPTTLLPAFQRPTCCGVSDTEFPNHQSGYGRIDAVRTFDSCFPNDWHTGTNGAMRPQ